MDLITIENADKALKDYYLQAVSAQLNDGISPFFSAIEKTTNNVYGKDVNLSIVRGYTGNVKACAEDGDLPDPYKNRYIGISVPLKNIFGRIEISDKALRASRDSSGAFVNLVNAEMEGLVASAKQNFQRMLFGDGTGFLCNITDDPEDNELQIDNFKEFYLGMQVDLFSDDDDTDEDATGAHIVAIDRAKSVVTIDKDVSLPLSGGKMYVHGGREHNELTGLGAIFGANELYGHKKADEPFFKPYIVDCGGTITESFLCDVLDHMEENFNSHINMILCSYKTKKKIAALIAEQKRVVNSIDARTGVGVVSVNDVPVYADKYCPEGEILFVNTDDFSLNQLCDWEWLEDEGGKILKQIPGKAAYGATLVKYAELICKKPCGQAKITGIK